MNSPVVKTLGPTDYKVRTLNWRGKIHFSSASSRHWLSQNWLKENLGKVSGSPWVSVSSSLWVLEYSHSSLAHKIEQIHEGPQGSTIHLPISCHPPWESSLTAMSRAPEAVFRLLSTLEPWIPDAAAYRTFLSRCPLGTIKSTYFKMEPFPPLFLIFHSPWWYTIILWFSSGGIWKNRWHFCCHNN